jgi:hypothetical protein
VLPPNGLDLRNPLFSRGRRRGTSDNLLPQHPHHTTIRVKLAAPFTVRRSPLTHLQGFSQRDVAIRALLRNPVDDRDAAAAEVVHLHQFFGGLLQADGLSDQLLRV